MRKFILHTLQFIIPIIIVSFGLDLLISKNLQETNESPGNYNTWNDIYNNNVNADILIYGSSRASMQIDPKILEDTLQLKVYNFGMLGHNFLTQYLRHQEFIKYNPAPKKIILSVDYFSFEKRKDLYESDQFLPYMLWNYNIWKHLNTYDGFSFLEHSMPLLRYYGKGTARRKAFKEFINKPKTEPLKYKGYKSTKKQWSTAMELARKKRGNYTIKNDPEVIRLFDQFIKECKEKNIELTLVYTPEFFEEHNLISNLDDTFKIINTFSLKYGLSFLNYSEDPICYNKAYFYNALHLNQIGSELFTKKLAHDLLEIKKKK